jgi:hypothetical protein
MSPERCNRRKNDGADKRSAPNRPQPRDAVSDGTDEGQANPSAAGQEGDTSHSGGGGQSAAAGDGDAGGDAADEEMLQLIVVNEDGERRHAPLRRADRQAARLAVSGR